MAWFNAYNKKMNILQYVMIYISAFGFSIIFMLYIFHIITIETYLLTSLFYLSLTAFTYVIVNRLIKNKIVGKHVIIQHIKYQLPFNQNNAKTNPSKKIKRTPYHSKGFFIPKWAYFKENHEISLYETLNNPKYPLQLYVVKYNRSGLALVKDLVTNVNYLVDLRNANYLV